MRDLRKVHAELDAALGMAVHELLVSPWGIREGNDRVNDARAVDVASGEHVPATPYDAFPVPPWVVPVGLAAGAGEHYVGAVEVSFLAEV